MSTTTSPHPGVVLPLPHLGPHAHGTVTDHRWSEALGLVVLVRVDDHGRTGTHLLYGDTLDRALTDPLSPAAA